MWEALHSNSYISPHNFLPLQRQVRSVTRLHCPSLHAPHSKNTSTMPTLRRCPRNTMCVYYVLDILMKNETTYRDMIEIMTAIQDIATPWWKLQFLVTGAAKVLHSSFSGCMSLKFIYHLNSTTRSFTNMFASHRADDLHYSLRRQPWTHAFETNTQAVNFNPSHSKYSLTWSVISSQYQIPAFSQ